MSLAAYWIVTFGFIAHYFKSWVSFSTVVYVDVACLEGSALIAWMIMGLTDLAQ
jgi:hypothetical protein